MLHPKWMSWMSRDSKTETIKLENNRISTEIANNKILASFSTDCCIDLSRATSVVLRYCAQAETATLGAWLS